MNSRVLIMICIILAPAIVSADITDGLVAHLPLDTNANDISGNGNNGIISGNPHSVPGVIGQAMEFDGAKDYIKLNRSVIGSYCSICLWFNSTQTNTAPDDGFPVLIRLHDYGIMMVMNEGGSGKLSGKLFNTHSTPPQYSYRTTEGVYNDGEWHHMVVAYGQPDGFTVYIDGVLRHTDNTNGMGAIYSNTNSGVFLARDGGFYSNSNEPGTCNQFKGKLDDVRIYNRALTEDEVQEIYAESDSGEEDCLLYTSDAADE